MKNKISSIILFILIPIFSYSILCYSGELTGAGMVANIMARQNMNLNSYLKSGNNLLLGEVTGAGRSVDMGKIKVIIAMDSAFLMSDLNNINFNQNLNNVTGMYLENVSTLEINHQIISKRDITGLVISK